MSRLRGCSGVQVDCVREGTQGFPVTETGHERAEKVGRESKRPWVRITENEIRSVRVEGR